MYFSNVLLTTSADSGGGLVGTIVLMVVMVAVFYFLLIRPQRKREKQTAEMRNKIEIGDGVVTIGGVIGRVVSIKDETILIETGTDRTKLRIQRWAVQEVEKLEIDD
ncbi:MAG: preprotein translocase subunit YajC [Oscillospiraceae bacterium]|nr:preprotein translocase subunit YajC [Oscillospiraceae bacterium]